jgi:hypothetical protein
LAVDSRGGDARGGASSADEDGSLDFVGHAGVLVLTFGVPPLQLSIPSAALDAPPKVAPPPLSTVN